MSSSKSALSVRIQGADIHLTIDNRHYRVRGLQQNLSSQQLRLNILAERDGLVHLDTFDLWIAKARASFIKAAASELYVDEQLVKQDVGRRLLELEKLQLDQIEAAQQTRQTKVELTAEQRESTLSMLRDPQLISRILADYDRCGLVGEESSKLVCYLACVSRLLPQPLALLIHSGSAAGKTSLMDATLAFVPAEDTVRYSAMTGQSPASPCITWADKIYVTRSWLSPKNKAWHRPAMHSSCCKATGGCGSRRRARTAAVAGNRPKPTKCRDPS